MHVKNGLWLIAWHLFLRDFRVRYRRAYFGVLWAWISVLGLGISITFLAGELGSQETNDLPRVLTIVVGLVVWQVFAGAVSVPQQLARRSRTLLCTIPLPSETLPAASVITVLVSYLMQLPVVFGLLLWYGVGLDWSVFGGLVAGFVIMVVAGLSLGTLLLPLSLVFTDVRYSMSLLQGAMLMATPVLYPLKETGVLASINRLNPLTPLLLGIRNCVLGIQAEFSFSYLLIFAAFAAALVLALHYNRRFMGMAIAHI